LSYVPGIASSSLQVFLIDFSTGLLSQPIETMIQQVEHAMFEQVLNSLQFFQLCLGGEAWFGELNDPQFSLYIPLQQFC
jgi:hypothetical protein